MKDKIKEVLTQVYGRFESNLEHQYEIRITEALLNDDMEVKKEWVTYNQVILELKHNLKEILKVKELQYKLTDETNPNIACMGVIEEIIDRSPELERLYHKIKNFK